MQAGIYKTCFVDFNNFNVLIKIFSGLSSLLTQNLSCAVIVFLLQICSRTSGVVFFGGEGVDKVILASLSYKNVEVPKLSVI
jgi:hypothetical protein